MYQSGQVSSVLVDTPPPQSASGTISTASIWDCRFVCPTALSHMLCPCNPLGWPTAQVPFSLKFSPLKSQVAVSTRHLDKRALWGSLGRAGRRHPGFLRQSLCLVSHVSFILGNFPVLWATKISLKMQL